jgi:hypothetical protein
MPQLDLNQNAKRTASFTVAGTGNMRKPDWLTIVWGVWTPLLLATLSYVTFKVRPPQLAASKCVDYRVQTYPLAASTDQTRWADKPHRQDVQIEIADSILTIRGEKKSERSGDGKYFTERYYGSFERQIPLDNVQEDKAEASFKDGVLTISLPKSDKAREDVKRIAIKTN